jgi:hypothetical protein
MQRSYAWRVLSRAAHQCLSRIEIELADHGGKDIDELPVTFNDFEEYGVNRHAIGPALAELRSLGFIDITERGLAARAAEYRRSNKFRLLTRPWETKGSTRPRWNRFESLAEAEADAAQARRSAKKEKSASAETTPKPVRKPHPGEEKASAETAPLANVGNRTTIYISGGRGRTPDEGHGPTPTPPPDDGASDSRPSPPVFDLIENSFRIGDRRIELRKPVAAVSLTAGQLAHQLAASHPSNADTPMRPRRAVVVGAQSPTPTIAAE